MEFHYLAKYELNMEFLSYFFSNFYISMPHSLYPLPQIPIPVNTLSTKKLSHQYSTVEINKTISFDTHIDILNLLLLVLIYS